MTEQSATLDACSLSCFSFRPSQAFGKWRKSAPQSWPMSLPAAPGNPRFSLLSFVLLIYSLLSGEERVLHLLWASHGSGALFSDSRASPANCLRRFRNGLRVCGCHHLPPRAHNGLQGQTRRESTLVIPFCPIGSSLSTASQILIRGFVISHASFPCQQIRPGQAPAGWLPQKQLLASELS